MGMSCWSSWDRISVWQSLRMEKPTVNSWHGFRRSRPDTAWTTCSHANLMQTMGKWELIPHACRLFRISGSWTASRARVHTCTLETATTGGGKTEAMRQITCGKRVQTATEVGKCRKKSKMPPVCRKTHLSQDMFEHVLFIRKVCSHAHSLTTRARVAQGLRALVSQKVVVIPASCLILAALFTEHICTFSLTYFTYLATPSPSQSGLLELDPFTLRDSRQSGGSTEIPSPTQYGGTNLSSTPERDQSSCAQQRGHTRHWGRDCQGSTGHLLHNSTVQRTNTSTFGWDFGTCWAEATFSFRCDPIRRL